ncbi:MAG: metallophosphoesterase [Paenibacillus sp.]|nr:metallophosphoesterase [Paenibacillus sp.]
MKLLIISDIHSNIDSLEAILQKEKNCDLIYCAGDLVDVGFHPQEVIDCVRENKIISVRGNHDELVIQMFRSGKHLEDLPNEELTWPIINARKLDESSITYLENLPKQIDFQIGEIAYGIQHLYKGYDTIGSYNEFMNFWNQQTIEESSLYLKKRLIFGHTHKQCVTYFHNDCLWMNPGSVGYNRPDDPSIAAHYITITNGNIELNQVEHKKSITRQEMGRLFAEYTKSL